MRGSRPAAQPASQPAGQACLLHAVPIDSSQVIILLSALEAAEHKPLRTGGISPRIQPQRDGQGQTRRPAHRHSSGKWGWGGEGGGDGTGRETFGNALYWNNITT